jgi:glycosyltransferase involved in cell wall biosynthesis
VKKLIVQIPCLNEAETLPITLGDIPRAISGVDAVEILVVDDGSRDGTADVARLHGADYIVRFPRRKGLAAAFTAGIDACVKLGADIIVNTDGDNQYVGADIPALIGPLLRGEADVVIGDREVQDLAHMSAMRKRLQWIGSWVVRQVSDTKVPDTTSGFRAYTREAALRMTIVSDFTYTLESIIQAGKKRMAIAHVPIRSNPRMRSSRLFSNVWTYIKASTATIIRIYATYEPLKVFGLAGLLVFAGGLAVSLRFVYFYLVGEGLGHVQSLILAAVLLIVGFQIALIGLVADVISGNRRLLEDLLYRVRRMELRQAAPADVEPRRGDGAPAGAAPPDGGERS